VPNNQFAKSIKNSATLTTSRGSLTHGNLLGSSPIFKPGQPIVLTSTQAAQDISAKYSQLGGGSSFLGAPLNDRVQPSADGIGFYIHYQGGSIFWTPSAGAFSIHGGIRDKWASLGWERSFLGYPLTDETGTPDGVGRYNHFQGGSVYWTPGTGAHEVHGAIRDKWAAMGWESGLGYPLTDETGTPDGVGRYNHFQGGSVYWTPGTGAHEVHGAIRDKWEAMGWETSYLGYPVSDEEGLANGGRISAFQGGNITWNLNTGPVPTPPPLDKLELDTEIISFDGGVPAGGWGHLSLFSNGAYSFSGHFHVSGAPSYDLAFVWLVKTSKGSILQFVKSGRLHGTLEPGSRDFDWGDSGINPALATVWNEIAGGYTPYCSTKVNVDLGALLDAAMKVINAAGAVAGAVGKIISIV
jgi:uncharacterized protein with LGFP repeats